MGFPTDWRHQSFTRINYATEIKRYSTVHFWRFLILKENIVNTVLQNYLRKLIIVKSSDSLVFKV
jgi:hypothetical protein